MMFNKFFKVFLLFVLCIPAVGFSKPMLNIQHWQTKNGAKVYFVETHELPMLDAEVLFDAGSSRDAKAFGLAELTGSMLSEGAGQKGVEQIASKFDDVGAQFSVNTDRDTTSVRLRTLTEAKALKPALQMFQQVLSSPTFPAKSLKRIKAQMLTAIQAQQQDPSSIAFKAFMHALYGDKPYGHLSVGNADTVAAITTKQLKAFYKQYYVANNAIVVLVGDISRDKADKVASELVMGLPAGQHAAPLKESNIVQKSVIEQVNLSIPQTVILMGNVAIARDNSDYFPLMLGNYVLGGGMTSRLFNVVRERDGLTYNINSQFAPLLQPGPFFVSLQTKNKTAKQADKITKQVIKNFLKSGVKKAELLAAKQNFINGLPMKIDSNAQIANAVGGIALYGLPLDYFDQYTKSINDVTALQIQKAFNRYVKPSKMTTVIVGGKASGE